MESTEYTLEIHLAAALLNATLGYFNYRCVKSIWESIFYSIHTSFTEVLTIKD